MKVYFGNSLGCTLWAIALTIVFFVTAGFFIKLLVTTPLGLILLALMAFGYFRNRQRIQEFGRTGGFYWSNGMNNSSRSYDEESDRAFNNISGAPQQNTSFRSAYENFEDAGTAQNIDRSSYQNVEDAEFVEIRDEEKK